MAADSIIGAGLMPSPYAEAIRERDEARRELAAAREALAEIREVWAGAECGEPIYAQEAYAIRLCRQMCDIACAALAAAPAEPKEASNG